MADSLTPGTVNDPKHNMKARNAIIQKQFGELFKLEQEKAAAIEKHVKKISDEIKKVRHNLKADTDIDSKDLNLFYKIFARQEEGKKLEEEDANRIADNLRSVFDALKDGGQLDFIDSIKD